MTVHTRFEHDRFSDLALAARVAARDERAVRLVTQRNNQRLFRAAWSILKDRDEAEDAVQTAYLRAFTAIAGFRGTASLSTWLTRIAINVALGRLRAIRRKRASLQSDLFLDDYREQLHRASSWTSPHEGLARAQLGQLLEAAIAKLPAPFRSVIVLREIEGLGVSQVAEILAIPSATVRTRHLRARASLKQALAPDIGDSLAETLPFAGVDCERVTAWVIAAYCRPAPVAVPGSIETCTSIGPWTDGETSRRAEVGLHAR